MMQQAHSVAHSCIGPSFQCWRCGIVRSRGSNPLRKHIGEQARDVDTEGLEVFDLLDDKFR
jgi:hypothetical protein